MHTTLAEPMASIYAPNPARTEKYRLLTEPKSRPKAGTLQLRALNGFLFIKNGKFVFPTYEATKSEQWWTGVEAYGYMAALTGDYKYLIWSGYWEEEETPGRHLEVVKLENIEGMSKEYSVHWRAKSEPILWLETKHKIAYALLEPADEYDPLEWKLVVDSWTNARELEEGSAYFQRTDLKQRPAWWPKAGDKQWKRVQKLSNGQKPKTGIRAKEAKPTRGMIEARKNGPSKSKETIPMDTGKSSDRTSHSPRQKRRRPSDVSVSDGPSIQQPKKAHYEVPPSSPSLGATVISSSSEPEEPGTSKSKETSPPPTTKPSASSSGLRNPSKGKGKHLAKLSAEEADRASSRTDGRLADSNSKNGSSSKRQASKLRIQKEARGEKPRPATQEASAMPSRLPSPSAGHAQNKALGEKGERDVVEGAPTPHTASTRKITEDPAPLPSNKIELSSAPSTLAQPMQAQTSSGHSADIEPAVVQSISGSQPTEQFLGLSLAEPTVPLSSVAAASTPTPASPGNGHKMRASDSVDVLMADISALRPVRGVRASTVPPGSGVGSPARRYSAEAVGSTELDLDNRSSKRYNQFRARR